MTRTREKRPGPVTGDSCRPSGVHQGIPRTVFLNKLTRLPGRSYCTMLAPVWVSATGEPCLEPLALEASRSAPPSGQQTSHSLAKPTCLIPRSSDRLVLLPKKPCKPVAPKRWNAVRYLYRSKPDLPQIDRTSDNLLLLRLPVRTGVELVEYTLLRRRFPRQA